MRLIRFFSIICLISSIAFSSPDADGKKLIVNFESLNNGNDNLVETITAEFEEALIKSGCFQVLERRNIDFLKIKRNEELQIMLSEGSRHSDYQQLKTKNVKYIALGSIFEDNNAGNIKISVKIVNFGSQIIAYESVYTEKIIKMDPVKRTNYLNELVGKLCPKKNSLPVEQEAMNIKFILESAKFTGSSVEINLALINKGKSARFAIAGKTMAFDDQGRERYVGNVTIVDQSQNFEGRGINTYVYKRLVYNRSAKTRLTFNEFPVDATQISELILECHMDGIGYSTLIFKNIDL